MSKIRQQNPSPISVAAMIGFCVGFVLLIIAFFATFTICSDTTFAKLLFPFTIAVDPSLHDHLYLALFVALIQYPLYALTAAFVWKRKRSALWVCILALLSAHVLG